MLPLFSRNSQIIKIMNNNNQVLFDATNVDSKIISAFTPFYFKSNGNNLTNYEIYGNDNGVGNYDSITQKYLIPIKITGESTSQTITLSLDTALMEGQKITLTDTNINIPTYNGRNIITIETETQPAMILIKGQISFISKSIYTINYYNGSTLLGTEIIEAGLGERPQAKRYGSTPTKASTSQYTYTFAGWNENPNATSVDENALTNITSDKTLYAIFTQTLRTYSVSFYNGDTWLQTVSDVPYGGTATYTGATPTSFQAGYIFSGWSPSNTNITADTSCYAQFAEDDMYESITDTWPQIIANIGNGTYSTKYQVGDTKKIDLGTEGEVIMTIVGIDTDDLADNSGKAPITWISKQLLKTDHRMNPSEEGALGGWEDCEMRSYLINTIKPLIPSEVRNALKMVKKYSKIYNTSGTEVNNVVSNDDIWIPSVYEVRGFLGYETSGVTYSTAFPDNASRTKHKVGGSAAWWWLRSAYHSGAFKGVTANGQDDYYGAGTTSNSVALGFCT